MGGSGVGFSVPRIEDRELGNGLGIGAVVDIETTGLNHQWHEIIELALILFAYRRSDGQIVGVVDEYVGLRQPSHKIPAQVIRLHGITDAMVKGKALDHERVEALARRAEFFIAHNASFDAKFVSKLIPLCHDKPWLCSCHGINWLGKGLPNKRLETLIRAHHIRDEESHRALDDAAATLSLLAMNGSGGLTHFAELARRYGYLRGERARRRPTNAASAAVAREVAAAIEPVAADDQAAPLLADLTSVFRRHFAVAHPRAKSGPVSAASLSAAGPVAQSIIRVMIARAGGVQQIPLLRGGRSFKASLCPEGIMVTNLGSQPLLPWQVFDEVVTFLIKQGGRAVKGNAMNAKLGDQALTLESVEGHIAAVVYGKGVGDSVFRRITPITGILVWAGICASDNGELVLLRD